MDQCVQLRIGDLLKESNSKLKESMIQADLKAMGVEVELTTSKTCFGGIRLWFCCMQCRSRVGILYKHPLSGEAGCRKCLNLDYRKRRYKGMVEEDVI